MKPLFTIANKELFKDRQYYKNTPKHLLLLPDGDRRYAKEHNLNDFESYNLARKRTIDIFEVGFNEFGLSEITIFFLRQRSFNDQNRTVDNLVSIFTAIKNLSEDVVNNKTEVDGNQVYIDTISLAGKEWMSIPDGMEKDERLKKSWFDLKETLYNLKQRPEKAKKINLLINFSGKVEINEAIKTGKLQITNPIGLTVRVGDGMRLSDCPLYALSESHMYLIPKYYPAVTKGDYRKALGRYYAKVV